MKDKQQESKKSKLEKDSEKIDGLSSTKTLEDVADNMHKFSLENAFEELHRGSAVEKHVEEDDEAGEH